MYVYTRRHAHTHIYHIFMHSSVYDHLGFFHILAPAIFFLIPRSEVIGSYGSFIFNFCKKLHTVSYSGCTILHSHQ